MAFNPNDILSHVKTYLPNFTNLFTDELACNADILAGQILRINYPAHNKTAGQKIQVVNSLLDNGINNVVQFIDGAIIGLRFTTNVDHELTYGYNTQVELQGFSDSQFNGIFILYGVPDGNMFEILHDNLPVLNGNEVLRENRELGINRVNVITNIVDANNIEIDISDLPDFDIKPVYGLSIITNYRMAIVTNFKRLEELYTKQLPDSNWLFVIMEDVSASKERNLQNDATVLNTLQTAQRIKNIGRFTVDVIIPTKTTIAGASAIQLSYTTIYEALMNIITGFSFDTYENNYLCAMIGHGSLVYNNAYYGHGYTFEQVFETTSANTFKENVIQSVPFRRINISFAELQDGSNILL